MPLTIMKNLPKGKMDKQRLIILVVLFFLTACVSPALHNYKHKDGSIPVPGMPDIIAIRTGSPGHYIVYDQNGNIVGYLRKKIKDKLYRFYDVHEKIKGIEMGELVQTYKNFHQYLMDKAYDLWKNKNYTYNDFLYQVQTELGGKYYIAVIFGNLNQQVEKGGFLQWFKEGYSITCSDLVIHLKKYNDTPSFSAALTILEEVRDILDQYARCMKEAQRTTYKEMFAEQCKKLLANLERKNSGYKDIKDKFMQDMNEHLKEL